MDANTRYRPNGDNLTSTVIDGEAIIVNLTTGVYYSTDQVGGTVWQMIEQGRSLEEMATALAGRYDTTRERALNDLAALVAQMLHEQLLVVAEITSPSSAPLPEPDHGETKAPYAAPALSIYRDMEDLLALDPPMPGLRDIPLKEPDDASKP
jgi:hypothetical protein